MLKAKITHKIKEMHLQETTSDPLEVLYSRRSEGIPPDPNMLRAFKRYIQLMDGEVFDFYVYVSKNNIALCMHKIKGNISLVRFDAGNPREIELFDKATKPGTKISTSKFLRAKSLEELGELGAQIFNFYIAIVSSNPDDLLEGLKTHSAPNDVMTACLKLISLIDADENNFEILSKRSRWAHKWAGNSSKDWRLLLNIPDANGIPADVLILAQISSEIIDDHDLHKIQIHNGRMGQVSRVSYNEIMQANELTELPNNAGAALFNNYIRGLSLFGDVEGMPENFLESLKIDIDAYRGGTGERKLARRTKAKEVFEKLIQLMDADENDFFAIDNGHSVKLYFALEGFSGAIAALFPKPRVGGPDDEIHIYNKSGQSGWKLSTQTILNASELEQIGLEAGSSIFNKYIDYIARRK